MKEVFLNAGLKCFATNIHFPALTPSPAPPNNHLSSPAFLLIPAGSQQDQRGLT